MQKKNVFMKLAAILTIAVLSLGCVGVFASETPVSANLSEDAVVRRFTYINDYWNNFEIGSGGKATCEGETYVETGYLAGVTLELQQYVGYWKTIKTWESSDLEYMYIAKDWYVQSGYTYRLKATHTAYDRSWNILEEEVVYSVEKDY